ncbi:DEK protein [Ancylostoma caninum]|uniref:DEK protein n=1 Tax=Ancylostoma caninum TaxID=29170 RepID=A0A368G3I3_ANCCA|nr:DEK protein [Ancylostoma caninum]
MPLEVEGKRERHKVERISIGTPTVKKAPTEMKMGNGVPLGDIAYIEDQLKKHSANELQVIHRFIYGHVGKPTIIRREIRRFTGFAFEEDTPEFKHKVAYLQKLTIQQLNMMKKILGLHSGGNTKDALVTTIMVFMMKTVDHERKVPGKKRKSTAKTPTAKRSRKSKGSDEKKESETKETSPKTDSDSDSSEAAKKKTKKTTKKVKDSDDDTSSNSSAEAPQENKPSEEELETVIEELLSTFDLAQVSMKQMCQAVIERFPGTNIGNRVDFLKSKIKQCLSTK